MNYLTQNSQIGFTAQIYMYHLRRSGCLGCWGEMRLHLSPKGKKGCDWIYHIWHGLWKKKGSTHQELRQTPFVQLEKPRQQRVAASTASLPGSDPSQFLFAHQFPHLNPVWHLPAIPPSWSSPFQDLLSPSKTSWKFRVYSVLPAPWGHTGSSVSGSFHLSYLSYSWVGRVLMWHTSSP